MENPYNTWRERCSWLDWLVACMLANANQEAYDRLPRTLYLHAERELDRMINPWLIDRWDI